MHIYMQLRSMEDMLKRGSFAVDYCNLEIGIVLRKAFDIYYSSKLAEQISNDSYGIEILKCRLFKKYRTNIRIVLYFFYPE